MLCKFQLTPSRRATNSIHNNHLFTYNFNSRPHGGRPPSTEKRKVLMEFQLTPSRRATRDSFVSCSQFLFQLTPSRRATGTHSPIPHQIHISTHALTEGDHMPDLTGIWKYISTHALTEGDSKSALRCKGQDISTHALTEGDDNGAAYQNEWLNLNSRPHGGRHVPESSNGSSC